MPRPLTLLLPLLLALGPLTLKPVFAQADAAAGAAVERPPNVIIVFADDLGYGDLAGYGHPTIRTPNLDRMAAGGQRWTDFYAAASVCTPSRAGLLTGRLPVRSGMASPHHRVLFPDSRGGLPDAEVTLAEQLRGAGYATMAVGKWHLGHLAPHRPTDQGFDHYFGIPYSNDMDFVGGPARGYRGLADDSIRYRDYAVPLWRDTAVVERPADQRTITRRYTEEGLAFVRANRARPFFLYLAHNLPHIPLFAGADFRGTSARGLYGDVVEEIDDGVGQLLDLLVAEGLAENTIVVFTSDNGPWRSFGPHGGSAGPLRAGKGTTYEGGVREPCVMWGPGHVAPGVVRALGSTMDLFTTFSLLAGVPVPDDRVVDGLDLRAVWADPTATGPRESLLYYRDTTLYAARLGPYKAHFVTEGAYGQFGERAVHDPPLLYHLGVDPGEEYDVAAAHPAVVAEIEALVARHRAGLVRGVDQLAARGE